MIAAAPTRAFDAVVVVHACSAIAALVVLVVLRAAAGAVAATATAEQVPATALRSFRGRRELAGRVVHLVPLTGIVAVVVSRSTERVTDGFVVVGFALWLVAAIALEACSFPAQRRCAAGLRAGARDEAASAARAMAAGLTVATAAVVVAALVMVVAQNG